jgi:L-seryl-tRNA(Ser) seleniumtransferase
VGGRREAELRALPSVHELAESLDAPHALAVAAARRAIQEQRSLLLAEADATVSIWQRARGHLDALASPSLRKVVNATGVIIHTNLGRAPLSADAQAAVARAAAGYSNLELDLASGERGSRHDHVGDLLCELTGAQAAMVVNNGAGAVLLAVAALAGPGRSVIVSRGQLVEIGGGFRIPDVIAQAGSAMVEVGTTNRTHPRDYERALTTSRLPVGAILRVHQSNFRTQGFVADVSTRTLTGFGVPVIDDVGSGLLADATRLSVLGDEPDLKASVAAGAALVCCSGDKLLGGPQAGLLLGTDEAIAAAREHPLARALRIDKLSLAALEATLMHYRDPDGVRREIPVLAMLEAGESELGARARRLAAAIGSDAALIRIASRVGGGALPLAELEGPAVALAAQIEPTQIAARLRAGEPPVIARIHDGRLVLDPRTLTEDEVDVVAAAVRGALPAG